VIRCGVCGSENEAEARFCGTCGSPLTPAEATAIAKASDEAAKPETGAGDDVVVPGNGGARRDLGTGGEGASKGDGGTGIKTEQVVLDDEPVAGAATIVCSVCSTVNDASRTYCRKCANELRPAPPPPLPPPPPPPGPRISPVVAGLVAAGVVIAIGIGIVLALGPGGTATGTPSPTSPASLPPSGSVGTPGPTEPAFAEGDPSGSIVFARCNGSTDCVLVVVDPSDPGNERVLTNPANGSATDPAFSPNGTKVVFSLKDDAKKQYGLRVLDMVTLNVEPQSTGKLDSGGFFSPDGKDLVFAGARARDPGNDDSDREIRLDGYEPKRDSTPLTSNAIEDHDPVFTPDGKSVIWVQGSGDKRELKRIDLVSGDVTDLTSDEFNDVDPNVSPDGTTLVFASKRVAGTEFNLFLMDLATLEITPLPTMPGDEHDPWWSPGGRYIVFSGGDPDHNNLFIMDLADNSIDQLTDTTERDLAPSWR